MLGPRLGVGAGVDQQTRHRPAHRGQGYGDARPGHTLDASQVNQRRRHHRSGRAGRHHALGTALTHLPAGHHERRAGLCAHRRGRLVAIADRVGGIDELDLRGHAAAELAFEFGHRAAQPHMHTTLAHRQHRAGDSLAGGAIAAHRVERDRYAVTGQRMERPVLGRNLAQRSDLATAVMTAVGACVMRSHRVMALRTVRQGRRRNAVRGAALVAPGLGRLFLGDCHLSREAYRPRVECRGASPSARPARRRRSRGPGRRRAPRRSAGRDLRSPRGTAPWRESPAPAHRAPMTPRSSPSASRYSLVSSGSTGSSPFAFWWYSVASTSTWSCAGSQAALAWALEVAAEPQPQVDAVGGRLNAQARVDDRHDRAVLRPPNSTESQRTGTTTSRDSPGCSRYRRRSRTAIELNSTGCARGRTRRWPDPATRRRGPRSVRVRGAPQTGTW